MWSSPEPASTRLSVTEDSAALPSSAVQPPTKMPNAAIQSAKRDQGRATEAAFCEALAQTAETASSRQRVWLSGPVDWRQNWLVRTVFSLGERLIVRHFEGVHLAEQGCRRFALAAFSRRAPYSAKALHEVGPIVQHPALFAISHRMFFSISLPLSLDRRPATDSCWSVLPSASPSFVRGVAHRSARVSHLSRAKLQPSSMACLRND